MTDPVLLPCPHCGGKADFEEVAAPSLKGGSGSWTVGCEEADDDKNGICFGYMSYTQFATKREAAEAWNRRAAGDHDLYKTGDVDAPDCVKDRNGDVVLGLCRRCNAGEVELEQPCVVRLTAEIERLKRERDAWKGVSIGEAMRRVLAAESERDVLKASVVMPPEPSAEVRLAMSVALDDWVGKGRQQPHYPASAMYPVYKAVLRTLMKGRG